MCNSKNTDNNNFSAADTAPCNINVETMKKLNAMYVGILTKKCGIMEKICNAYNRATAGIEMVEGGVKLENVTFFYVVPVLFTDKQLDEQSNVYTVISQKDKEGNCYEADVHVFSCKNGDISFNCIILKESVHSPAQDGQDMHAFSYYDHEKKAWKPAKGNVREILRETVGAYDGQ